MTKVDIRRLDSVTTNDTTATQLINANFEALQTAIENTLSRDGTTPNFLDADIDLNSYKIINAGTPTNNTDVITKEYFDQNVGDAAGYATAAAASATQAHLYETNARDFASIASGAAGTAQTARDFIESDPGFITVSTDLLLGDNSEIHKVNANKTNIDTVAGSISNVNTVGTDIANVNAVAADLTNIDSVVTNMTDINNVADDLTKIVAVADDLTRIDNVADDLTNIDNVADDLTNINAVAGNATNINAVAGNASNINAVAGNATNINAVNANKTNIDAVAGNNANITAVANNATNINAVNANKTNIDTVATNIADVNSVAGDITNVTAVADDLTNIDAVAANNTDISAVAADLTNIDAVAADLTNIDAASDYAAEAKQWAIGDPTEPVDGSAKYWAGQAAAGQINSDWTETDTSSKAYILHKPTAGDNISFANNQISAVSDASPTSGSTNLVQSGGVYTGLNTLQQEIDTILLSSDVYDVVGTYTDLQNYDISTVPVNDIIKVLSDSTHSDAASYYRCTESGGVKSWTYVGSEGPYYTKSEANTLLNDKANISLSNLSSAGQAVLDAKQDVATAVNYDNISNCITEIPQDIKLELNNGTLTLKAGSKVYNGNGLLATTSADLQATWPVTGTAYISVPANQNGLYVTNYPGETVSSLPSPTASYKLYYNTTDRKCYFDEGSWTEMSFPIAIISATGQIPSIDQVFNGFGYIGSTVFALPGVKGLIPNGRNADGTLKNISFTTNEVMTQTLSSTAEFTLYLDSSTFGRSTCTSYYPKQNKVIDADGYHNDTCIVGNLTQSAATITQLKVKQPFHALDYNDSSTISGWSMPSSRYIDLTLGASGATYTAPTNGWFYLRKRTTGNQSIAMGNNKNTAATKCFTASGSSNEAYCFLPVLKGDGVWVTYNAAGETTYFRFVYAEGENV